MASQNIRLPLAFSLKVQLHNKQYYRISTTEAKLQICSTDCVRTTMICYLLDAFHKLTIKQLMSTINITVT